MSEDIEFDHVDRITVGAIGPPGRRTFYLQARRGLELVSLVVEKDQVVALAEGTGELFKSEGYPESSLNWDADSMALEQPIGARFRVGTIAIGYAEDRDLVLLECRARTGPAGMGPEGEGVEGIEDVAPGDEDTAGSTVRFWITKAQLEALSAYGMIVAAQGRPLCPLCRVPMDDPEDHRCFATNGHRTEA